MIQNEYLLRSSLRHADELSRRMYPKRHYVFEQNLINSVSIMDYVEPTFKKLFYKIHSNSDGTSDLINRDLSGRSPISIIKYFCNTENIYDVRPRLYVFFPTYPPQLHNILTEIIRHFTEPTAINQGKALFQTSRLLSRYNNYEPELMGAIREYIHPARNVRRVKNDGRLLTELIFNEEWQNELVERYEKLFQWLRTEGVRMNPELNEYIKVMRNIERDAMTRQIEFMSKIDPEQLKNNPQIVREDLSGAIDIADEEIEAMYGYGVDFLIYEIRQMLKLFFEATYLITPNDIF